MPYLVSFHLCKGLGWLIIFIFAKIGRSKIFVSFSAAMCGATMFMDGLLDVLALILGLVDPALIPDTIALINSVRTFVSYGLAAIGAIIQYFITYTKKDPKTGKNVTKLHDYGKAKRCNPFLKPPLSQMLKCITFLDNIIMKAMEGKMKLAPGNSLNPAQMGEMLKEMGGEMAEGVALKAAIKASKPILEPILKKIGLAFENVEMIFNREITELEDAKNVASDPMGFLNKIWASDKSTLLPSIVNNFGPKLNPVLEKSLLKWDDVKDQFNQILIDTPDFAGLIEKLTDPENILAHPAIKAKIDAAKAAAAKAAASEGGVQDLE